MITKPQKPVSTNPFSMRINPETRASLDYLSERTGLKDAQLFRRGIKLLEEHERALAAAAPKPARKTR
jgi:predicted DNA-binding protein